MRPFVNFQIHWCLPLIHMDNPTVEDIISQWRALDCGFVKLNYDVAMKENGKEARVAVVIRDNKGALVNGTTVSSQISSPLQGELLAIRQACGMACDFTDLGYQNVTIESDCQAAIKLSVSELVSPWEVAAVVWDIKRLGRR